MKISVLIPALNRPYSLKEALESVLQQTLQPYEIIIADDNVEDREKNFQIILPYLKKHTHIKFVQNIKTLGRKENYKNLFFLASGDYIKYLAEDDILYPKNLEILSSYLEQDSKIILATSKWDVIDKQTGLKIDIEAAIPMHWQNRSIDGKEVIVQCLQNFKNYVGEFSTYMFRKKDVDFTLFQCCGYEFEHYLDWLLWMMLARKGNIAYYAKSLSCLRYGQENDCLTSHCIRRFQERLLFISDNFLTFFQISLSNRFACLEDLYKELLYILKQENISVEEKERLIALLNKKTKKELQRCSPKESFINSTVSVIIVTYNNAGTIQECIFSLIQYLAKEDEIIIVDNNSSDETVAIIKSFDDDRIHLIESKHNLGYAKGINIGIEAATKEYYIFLNPDTIATKDFTKKLIAPLQNDQFAVAGPVGTYVARFQHISTFSYIEQFLAYFSYDEITQYLTCLYKGDPYQESKLLIGFCVAVSKTLIDKIGGLDEDLFLGNDDLEFSWRIQLFGYKQAIVKTCFIYHKGHESFHKSSSDVDKLVEESTNILAQKLVDHYGYGKVPLPEELWRITWFYPSDPKFAFMFDWRGDTKEFATIDRQILKELFSVAIILVNYKNWEDTKACVKSLKNMNYKNFAVIIVDNSEVSIEALKKYYGKEYKILEENENIQDFSQPIVIRTINLGFSHANNIAIKKVKEKFDYIWILNNDTLVEKNTLFHLLEVSLKTQSFAVTSKIKDYIDKEKVQYDGTILRYAPMWDKPDRIKHVKFLSGANLLLKSDIFDIVGLWSECYFLYYDDNDFFMRLLQHGYNVIYTPFTHIYHKGGSTIGRWKETPLSIYYATRNKALFQKKFFGEIKDDFFNTLLEDYFLYMRKKEMIRSICSAMVDTFVNKIGKSFDMEFVQGYKKKYEYILRERYKNIEDKIFLDLYIECMNKPRDKEKFLNFVKFMKLHKEKIYANLSCIDYEK